jgi:subfamily B ATP-binding cassette protein MsbA
MQTSPKNKVMVVRLWRFIRSLRWLLLLACLLATVKTLVSIGFAAGSRWLLNNHNDLSESQINLIYITLAVVFVLFAFVIYFRVYLPVFISSNVMKKMRLDLYRHLQRLSADFYVQHKTGEILSRMTNDLTEARLVFSEIIINVTFDFMSVVAATAYIVLTYPAEIYWPVLVLGLVYGLLIKLLFPKLRHGSKQVQAELGRMTGDVSERIVGMKVLQSFTQEDAASELVDSRLESHYTHTIRMAKLQSFMSAVVQFMPELVRVLVVVIGIAFISSSTMTVGDITGLILVLSPIFFSIRRTGETSAQLSTSIGALDRVFDFFDAQPSVEDVKKPVLPSHINGNIVFQNVSFHYPLDSETTVLEDISFSIEAGKQVAFVGPSGAGKSTMMDLISRFYDPASGKILVDDYDIRELYLKFLRQNIGIVMQETILFSGTIADNMHIGKPDAMEAEIITALKNAYAWEFVSHMSDGINSYVGERGVNLSGGEKQRLAIARVFLKNPRILILDEATSALDADSEYYVQEALNGLMQDRTTLIIAHRLSTVKDVDTIFVIEDGRITDQGTHTELLSRSTVFKSLYEKQSLAFEDEL